MGNPCGHRDHIGSDDKSERLRGINQEWPPTRQFSSESGVRRVIDTLLHIFEVVRPGRYFVGHMLNQLGLTPVRPNYPQRGDRWVPIWVGPTVHSDVHFWGLIVAGEMVSPTRLGSTPLIHFVVQPSSCLLWSDISCDAIVGYFMQPGFRSDVWRQFEFRMKMRRRFRGQVNRRDDLSIDIPGFFAMVVGGWLFIVQSDKRPDYPQSSIRMRSDSSSSVAWVYKC